MIIVCCAYAQYGDQLESNILLNYPKSGILASLQIFVSLLVLFSYPLQSHPCRKSILSLLDQRALQRGVVLSDYRYKIRYVVITVSLKYAFSILIFVSHIDKHADGFLSRHIFLSNDNR